MKRRDFIAKGGIIGAGVVGVAALSGCEEKKEVAKNYFFCSETSGSCSKVVLVKRHSFHLKTNCDKISVAFKHPKGCSDYQAINSFIWLI